MINWETVGAIGEVLGAFGVIATLGYLAIQIRHANKLASWQTHKSAVEANAMTMNLIVNDDDTARIYRVGFINSDALNETEKIRFHQLATQMVLNYKDILDAYDKGLFDFPTYEAWLGFVSSHLVMPGGRLWWKDHEQAFIPRVRDEINKGMLEVPRADATSNTFWSSDAEIEIINENPERFTSRKPSKT